jgi:hypothetical protein
MRIHALGMVLTHLLARLTLQVHRMFNLPLLVGGNQHGRASRRVNRAQARQTSIGRMVALKVMPAHTMRDVQMIAGLPIHDYGEIDNRPYIVMAYLSGGTLVDAKARILALGGEISADTP